MFSLSLLGAAGCACSGHLPGGSSTARIASVNLENLSKREVTLLFDLELTNAHDAEIHLDTVAYELSSGGVSFLSGAVRSPGSIAPHSWRTMKVPVLVSFAELASLLEGIELGSVIPYEAQFGLELSANGKALPELPVREIGELPLPLPPEVVVESMRWREVSLSRAAAVVTLRLANRNEFSVELERILYSLTLDGSRVARGELDERASIPPGAERTIQLQASFAPRSVAPALVDALLGEGARYELAGTVRLSSQHGSIGAPYATAGDTVLRGQDQH